MHRPVITPPPQSPDEAARLQALMAYGILDTPPEHDFDQLATLAAQLCRTPMAVVTFVDRDRQWFKAAVGVPVPETDRAIAFCAHAIANGREPFVIPDTSQNAVFAHNPLVLGAPHVKFYACVPLVTADGHALARWP